MCLNFNFPEHFKFQIQIIFDFLFLCASNLGCQIEGLGLIRRDFESLIERTPCVPGITKDKIE